MSKSEDVDLRVNFIIRCIHLYMLYASKASDVLPKSPSCTSSVSIVSILSSRADEMLSCDADEIIIEDSLLKLRDLNKSAGALNTFLMIEEKHVRARTRAIIVVNFTS